MLRDSKEGTAMHSIYYNTMHEDPDQFYIKIDDALDRISNSPQTLYWAPVINIIGRGHLYEALKIEEQKTSMTGMKQYLLKKVSHHLLQLFHKYFCLRSITKSAV